MKDGPGHSKGTRWIAPPEFSGPTPRRVRMTWRQRLMILVLTLSILVLLGVGVLGDYYTFSHVLAVQRRGVETTAEVTSAQFLSNGDSGGGYKLSYRFEAKDPASAGTFVYSNGAIIDQTWFGPAGLHQGSRIPVLYDPQDPFSALVNAGGYARSAAPRDDAFFGVETISIILIVVYGLLMGLLAWFHLRDRRLLRWGHVAEGAIVSEQSYYTKGGRFTQVHYSFVDGEGERRQAYRKGVPPADSKSPKARQYRDMLLTRPVVLYDPANPARSTLYPAATAELA